jgi:hypothetical protein
MPFHRVRRHDVVDLSGVTLPVSVDAADPLLHVHRVPWQITVERRLYFAA